MWSAWLEFLRLREALRCTVAHAVAAPEPLAAAAADAPWLVILCVCSHLRR
jgi:hypothetical protein